MGQWGCMRREKQWYNNDIQRFTLFRYLFITLADAPILYTRNRDSKPSRKFTQFRNVIGFLPNYKQSCNASARGIAGTERSPVSKVSQNYRSTQTLFRSRGIRGNGFHNSDFFSLSSGWYTREDYSIVWIAFYREKKLLIRGIYI